MTDLKRKAETALIPSKRAKGDVAIADTNYNENGSLVATVSDLNREI